MGNSSHKLYHSGNNWHRYFMVIHQRYTVMYLNKVKYYGHWKCSSSIINIGQNLLFYSLGNNLLVLTYRDPNELKRTSTHISWFPDGPRKLAIAYCNLEFQGSSPNTSFDSYIWDVGEYFLSVGRLETVPHPLHNHIKWTKSNHGMILWWSTL